MRPADEPVPAKEDSPSAQAEGAYRTERDSIHFRGRVVDDQGAPVEGAVVHGAGYDSCRRGFRPYWEAVTGEGGRFEAEASRSDLLWEYRHGGMASATARGYFRTCLMETSEYVSCVLGGGDPDEMVIVLDRMAWIEGTVMDEVGNPLPGFGLTVRQWNNAGGDGMLLRSGEWERMPLLTRDCRSDPRGWFSYRGIRPEECTSIEVWPDGGEGGTAVVRVEGPFKRGGSYRADVVVPGVGPGKRPPNGPWVFSGVVMDETGRPVEGADWTGGGVERDLDWPKSTPPDGSFEFFVVCDASGLTVREPVGFLRARGFLDCPLYLTASELDRLLSAGRLDGLRCTMRRPSALEVCVVDESGAPLEGVMVAVTTDPHSRWLSFCPQDPLDPPPPDSVAGNFTDGDGRMRCCDLDSEEVLYVLAWKEGRTPTRIPLAGRLSEGGTARVLVVLPPLKQVPLEITLDGGERGMEVRMDYELVPAESRIIKMTAGDGPHVVQVMDFAGHEVGRLAFVIPRESDGERVTMKVGLCDNCKEEKRGKTGSE
jgi:protocatechuate 3,4-dioxygenase beta subunit